MKKGDNVAVLWPIASCVCCGVAVRPHGAPTRRCSADAWRTDHPAVRVPRPNAVGTAGRNSRECPLEPAAPAGRSWAVASGMLHRTGVLMAPRSGSCDGSDAATRHGVEGTQQPKWTMSSTNMRLSDSFGIMLAAGRPLMKDYNVTMEMFVREPDGYVQDQRLPE
ncbi:putative retrotransposon hot spot (RHS) protein [Trypanosoma cruzi]|uniref:Putative retrotransposon hot spot (RHS) protein n=1 Tax=Trypanosoma cruzi TaxID=5693 RepID=A0A2V2UFR5_TRYCR|nr:putative retrotransposon hot spot (RHS) protein [Trypanosoma cruzi]